MVIPIYRYKKHRIWREIWTKYPEIKLSKEITHYWCEFEYGNGKLLNMIFPCNYDAPNSRLLVKQYASIHLAHLPNVKLIACIPIPNN